MLEIHLFFMTTDFLFNSISSSSGSLLLFFGCGFGFGVAGLSGFGFVDGVAFGAAFLLGLLLEDATGWPCLLEELHRPAVL